MTTLRNVWLSALVLVVLVAGCADATEEPGLAHDPADVGMTEDLAGPVDDLGSGEETDAAEPEPERTGRIPTRMTVEQLARSIPIITGGIAWVEDFGDGPIDLLTILAPTLGAPDYLLVTEENLEPSLIIAKFMQDAAGRVCTKWVARDLNAPVDERTLVTHEDWKSTDGALVKANLRRLQLRFFTRWVAEDDDAPIADLYELFVTASATAPTGSEAHDGWLGVCLAMMTDPAMLVY